MATEPKDLQLPPRSMTTEGKERRIGIELEMNGISLDRLAEVVAGTLGLQLDTDSRSSGRYERVLKGDKAGDWVIELDFNFLKELGREPQSARNLLDELEESAENLLARTATQLVPLEVVSPPLPMSRMNEVQDLIEALRQAGALGTSGKLLYAFGMQFNPEVPDSRPETLRDYIRAFLCLYDWLDARAEINLTRRLTSYIDPFPRGYVMKLLASRYEPDLSALIDDYLLDNPTRNRALDMLPLFSWLDEERVKRHVDDVLIKRRPTFHYRLPNCEIDDPQWGLHQAWNDWLEVEKLAGDPERLENICAAYQRHISSAFHLPGAWLRQLEKKWL